MIKLVKETSGVCFMCTRVRSWVASWHHSSTCTVYEWEIVCAMCTNEKSDDNIHPECHCNQMREERVSEEMLCANALPLVCRCDYWFVLRVLSWINCLHSRCIILIKTSLLMHETRGGTSHPLMISSPSNNSIEWMWIFSSVNQCLSHSVSWMWRGTALARSTAFWIYVCATFWYIASLIEVSAKRKSWSMEWKEVKMTRRK